MFDEIGKLLAAALVGGLGTWAYEAYSRDARRRRLLVRFRVEIAVVRISVQEIIEWSQDPERSMPSIAANLEPMVASWRRRLRPIVQELPDLIDADACAKARLYEEGLARCHGVLRLSAKLPTAEAEAMRETVTSFFSSLAGVLDEIEDQVAGLAPRQPKPITRPEMGQDATPGGERDPGKSP